MRLGGGAVANTGKHWTIDGYYNDSNVVELGAELLQVILLYLMGLKVAQILFILGQIKLH